MAADGTVVDNGAAANNVAPTNAKSGCKLRRKCPLNSITVPANQFSWYNWWKPQRYAPRAQQAQTQAVTQAQQLAAQQARMQQTAGARGRRGRVGQQHG